MIYKLLKNGSKVAEILQKGGVFSISYSNSIHRDALEDEFSFLMENTITIKDTTSQPGGMIGVRLGRSDKETFLIMERGVPGFKVIFPDGFKKPEIKPSIGEVL